MRLTLVSLLFFLLTLAPNVSAQVSNNVEVNARGENANASVRIINRLNTDSDSVSETKTETSVYISQEGEGTSQVTINDREWKLEGPGEIKVDERSDSSPEISEGNTPTLDLFEEISFDDEVLEDETIDENGHDKAFSEIIKESLENIKKSLHLFFSKIFSNQRIHTKLKMSPTFSQ